MGGTALEEYIMPLMIQSLTDPEEFVVVKVLGALRGMAELGLLGRGVVWEVMGVVGRFMVHPNLWVRQGMRYCFCCRGQIIVGRMRADRGYRSGGVYCCGHQVVESCRCILYCGPDGTAVLEGGDCAAGGGHDFGEFEETSMALPLASRDITRAT